ncbi:MAG: hypothetical protein KAJ44_06500 [Thermoplasmatales archaeon]|nr:hypothetical protein [Thermoplasmatales archaeon]
MVKKTKKFSNYKLDSSLSMNPSHPDRFKLSIYCRNNKTNKYLRSDNFHKDGRWPVHVHDPNSKGRKYDLVIGGKTLIAHYIATYLDSVKEIKLIEKEEDLEVLELNIYTILNDIVKEIAENEREK